MIDIFFLLLLNIINLLNFKFFLKKINRQKIIKRIEEESKRQLRTLRTSHSPTSSKYQSRDNSNFNSPSIDKFMSKKKKMSLFSKSPRKILRKERHLSLKPTGIRIYNLARIQDSTTFLDQTTEIEDTEGGNKIFINFLLSF